MRFLSRKTAGGEIKTKDRNVWRGGGRKKKERERGKRDWGAEEWQDGDGGRGGGRYSLEKS